MVNWKTTLTGAVGALAVILKTVFAIEIPTEAILTVTIFLVALFSKDAGVTGVAK